MKIGIVFSILFSVIVSLCFAQNSSQIDPIKESQEIASDSIVSEVGADVDKSVKLAGEFFGIPVPLENYYFAEKVVWTFNAKWRPIPQNDKELEDLTWQELLFSYEAFRRQIDVNYDEIDAEISGMLSNEQAAISRKDNPKEYEQWVKEKLNESIELFENQVAHLLKLKKLQQQVIDSINPVVSEEDAHQKFLDEYNTLSVELYQFDDLKAANEFYEAIKKDSALWEQKTKDDPKALKKPGFVALDFLINMWGFNRSDAYKMLEVKVGEFYPAAPIYKGYAVFKIIEIRKADEAQYSTRKQSYIDKVKTIKQYEGFKQWAKKLKEDANIKNFIKK